MLIFLSLIEDENNQNKFIEIYEKYKDLVFAICIKITKNYHLAEDATQITFFRIARYIEKISGLDEMKQKAYISKIAKSAGIKVSKKEKCFFSYDIGKQYSLPKDDNVQEEYITKDEYNHIIHFILNMDEKYRDVLILSYVVGLSTKEIAGALDKPIGTVQTQLKRGKELVKEKFKELNIKWQLTKQKY